MTKITVVVEKGTKKIIPFEFGIYGEIIINSNRPDITEDNTEVMVIDSKCIDWENSTILDKPCTDRMELHPFNLLYLP